LGVNRPVETEGMMVCLCIDAGADLLVGLLRYAMRVTDFTALLCVFGNGRYLYLARLQLPRCSINSLQKQGQAQLAGRQ
jgi:hypothetical protein